MVKYLFNLLFNIKPKFSKGYEIDGLEQIPNTGPAILILYHPPSPIDASFILSNLLLETKRKPIAIVDRMMFKVPGISLL